MEKRGLSAGQKRPEKGRNQIEENDGNPREKERWNRKRGERDKEFFREGPSKRSRAEQGRGPDERVRSVRVQIGRNRAVFHRDPGPRFCIAEILTAQEQLSIVTSSLRFWLRVCLYLGRH